MTRRRDIRNTQQSSAPVVLPHVLVAVDPGGVLIVTIDGEPFQPEPFAPAWQRSDFGRVMDRITDQCRTAVRVEVNETDGTIFTDIITPSSRTRRTGPELQEAPSPPVPTGTQLVEVAAEGFIPGEDVGVAIVVAHTDAAHTGHARALLEAALFEASLTGEVLLIGRVSGTYEIVRRP